MIPPAKHDSAAAANILTPDYDVPIRGPVYLTDETLRDGEQTVGVVFDVDDKLEIARLLFDAGVSWMMVGFPAVSESERVAARAIAELARTGGPKQLFALARAVPADVAAVRECGIPNLVCWLPVSDLHMRYKLQTTEEQATAKLVEAIRLGVDSGLDVLVALEDATRAPMARIERIVKRALEAGATRFTLADTMGVLTPLSTYRIVGELVTMLGKVELGIHFHNDLGLATANSLAAVQAGAQILTGSFAGLGERAGNACLEELAVILRLKYGLDLGIDLAKLTAAAHRIAQLAHLPPAPTKPILGANAFSHESGIHVQGVTNEPATYEPFPPAWIGRRHEIHYGKHSGIASVRYLAREAGIAATDAQLEEALVRIKSRAEQTGVPSPVDAAEILAAVVAGK